jgi:hypothetical protein
MTADPTSLAERIQRLQDRGEIVAAEDPGGEFEIVGRRKGGLQRFLEDRGK